MGLDLPPGTVLVAIAAVLAFLLLAEPGPLARGMRFVLDTISQARSWPVRGVGLAWLGVVALALSLCCVAIAGYWAVGIVALDGEQGFGFVILCAAAFAWTALVLDQASDLARRRLQAAETLLLTRIASRWPDLGPRCRAEAASLGDLAHAILDAERRADEWEDPEDEWYRSLVEGIY